MAELSLPSSLREKARLISERVEELQQLWPEQIVLRAGTVSIYDCFPYLFTEAFPSLRQGDLDRFAVAARLYASSIFLNDKLFDEGAIRDANAHLAPVNALRIIAMQWEAYRQLHELFPAQSVFWEDFRRYLSQFTRACVEEQKFIAGGRAWGELTEDLALDIARGKNGVARTTIAGLAEMDGSRSALEPLAQAIDDYNSARQMLDDLCDWKEDLESGMPSLLLARVLGRKPAWQDEGELSTLKAEAGREIFYGGHAKYLMELAVSILDQAETSTAEWPNLTWRKVQANLRQQCTVFLEDLERIVAENVHRAEKQQSFELKLPAPLNEWQKLGWRALGYIIEQWHLGFGEARHIMEFPPEAGFSGPQYQRGDVFQRAIIADILCDVDEVVKGKLQPIIEQEVCYLLSRRDPGRCGWSYFPELPELPADADDLAQIMQVLWRSGHRREIHEFCAGPLSILLEDNRHADGSFETWIIPTSGRTGAERRQAEFACRMWGTGPDAEVVANLLYALALVQGDRYSEHIDSGVRYLEGRQSPKGYWDSSWYHGPYYGTYACMRLLSRISPEPKAIRAAADFLRLQQNSDGGWGNEGCSNALDTSLALLGLASLRMSKSAGGENSRCASRALAYLQQCGNHDGSWPKCEFIRMDTGRATGAVSSVLSYGSHTMTTGFVLKAALAWHELAQADDVSLTRE
jgi:squalene-hopene/tetraprenyl-beta-curcumene cyclase